MNTTDNLYYDWPLTTLIIGGHEPPWVEGVIARVNELDHEALTVLTGYMIIVTRDEVMRG